MSRVMCLWIWVCKESIGVCEVTLHQLCQPAAVILYVATYLAPSRFPWLPCVLTCVILSMSASSARASRNCFAVDLSLPSYEDHASCEVARDWIAAWTLLTALQLLEHQMHL